MVFVVNVKNIVVQKVVETMNNNLPGYCVECHKPLKKAIICDECQELLSDPPWDIDIIPPKSEWKNITTAIGEQLDESIKKEKN